MRRICVLVSMLALAGCGSSDKKPTTSTSPLSTSTDTGGLTKPGATCGDFGHVTPDQQNAFLDHIDGVKTLVDHNIVQQYFTQVCFAAPAEAKLKPLVAIAIKRVRAANAGPTGG